MADTDYPASWYAATRDFSPDRPPLAGRIEADVAIVGGGFAGLHTARLLAMRGAASSWSSAGASAGAPPAAMAASSARVSPPGRAR